MQFLMLVSGNLRAYLPLEDVARQLKQRIKDMAAIDTPRVQFAADTHGRIGRFFADALATFIAWNDARVTRNALSKLSDRELEDIGLCRGDIDVIASKF